MDHPQFQHIQNPMGIVGAVSSLIGGRGENQDSYLVAETPLGMLVIVCDGMGGGPAGKTASLLASRTMADYVANSTPDSNPAEVMAQSVVVANDALNQATMDNPAMKGMGTTCVAVLINKGRGYLVHIGDSRGYQLRNGEAIFRTADHSYVGELVRKGQLTEEEARTNNFSNVITRAIGGDVTIEPEVDIVEVQVGDRFALMSDGIWGAMPEPQLIAALSQQDPIDDIVNEVTISVDNMGLHKGGGHDNLTLALIELSEEGLHSGLLIPSEETTGWSISDPEDVTGVYVIEDDAAPSSITQNTDQFPKPIVASGGRTLAEKVAQERALKAVARTTPESSEAADENPGKIPPNPSSATPATTQSDKKSENKWKPYFWIVAVLLICLIGYNVWGHFRKHEEVNDDKTQVFTDSLTTEGAAAVLADNSDGESTTMPETSHSGQPQSPANPQPQFTSKESAQDPAALAEAMNVINRTNNETTPQTEQPKEESNKNSEPEIKHSNPDLQNILNQLAALKQKYPDQFHYDDHKKEFEGRKQSRAHQIQQVIQALNKYKRDKPKKTKDEVDLISSGLKSSGAENIDRNFAQPTGDAINAINRYLDRIKKLE